MRLADEARQLLNDTLRAYADSPRAASWLRRQWDRLDEPVRIAVAGPPGSGKSTLVAALRGDRRSRAWRDLALVDTPGDAAPAAVCADADAVLYLVRNRHGRELDGLRRAFDHPVAAAAPVSVVAVLSRTDELGAGRVDALTSARQLARRYRRDLEVHSVCQDVVAVAGLVGLAGRTLTSADFSTLTVMARLPRPQLDAALLSADRFVHTDLLIGLWADARQALLDRFGLFGLRLVTTLLRTGVTDQARLQAELVQRSGLGELRDSVQLFFVDRDDVLKARSALLAVDSVLRAEPRPAAGPLAAALERVLAGAHEFRELRLQSALRAGRVPLPDELAAEAAQVTGELGTGVLARLGFNPDGREPTEAELRHAILDTLDRWQAYAADPRAPAEVERAARVVVRSCEGMLAALYDGVLDMHS